MSDGIQRVNTDQIGEIIDGIVPVSEDVIMKIIIFQFLTDVPYSTMYSQKLHNISFQTSFGTGAIT